MKRLAQFPWSFLGGAAVVLVVAPFLLAQTAASPSRARPVRAPDQTPLAPAAVQDLVRRALANQHRDDRSLDLFERIEHRVEYRDSSHALVTEDKTFRVVPTGSGNIKIPLKRGGHSVSESDYRRALQNWEGILEVAIHPKDPHQEQLLAKQEKKFKDRARFLDAVPKAYNVTWAGREVLGGRILEKLHFTPKPDYVPQGNSTDWLVHARATVWIDRDDAQVARVEAQVIRDIPVGAGILGKLYRGSRILLEQAPAAPGIWEVTDSQYDISGRKFLFPFALHEVITTRHYRFLGSPENALAMVRQELAGGAVVPADP